MITARKSSSKHFLGGSLDWSLLRGLRLALRRPDLVFEIIRTHCTRRKVLLVYCRVPAHRQALSGVIQAIHEVHGNRVHIIVANDNYPRPQRAESLPPGVREFDRVPLAYNGLFRAHAVLTAASGYEHSMAWSGAKLIHFIHSLGSLDGLYLEHHFDEYDYIVCAGEHQVKAFQEWRTRRTQLAGLTLVRGGYPKLDQNLADAARSAGAADGRTVVYAPTFAFEANQGLASLRSHGPQIVESLLEAGYSVIFRPHPVSLMHDGDRETVDVIVERNKANPRFSLDASGSYADSYGKASAMVTDLSGTGFSYAFTYGRPVLFFAPDAAAEAGMQGIQFDSRERIGGVARTIPGMVEVVENRLRRQAEYKAQIEAFRAQMIFNIGRSARYVADRLPQMLAGETCDDWVTM
jgi:hypothetical protein